MCSSLARFSLHTLYETRCNYMALHFDREKGLGLHGPYTLRSHGVIPTTPNAKQGLLDVKFLTWGWKCHPPLVAPLVFAHAILSSIPCWTFCFTCWKIYKPSCFAHCEICKPSCSSHLWKIRVLKCVDDISQISNHGDTNQVPNFLFMIILIMYSDDTNIMQKLWRSQEHHML